MPRYRLGFLLCDHAIDVLAERHGDYPEMFATAFAEVSDAIDWHVYDVTAGELPSAVDECDGYLVSGSRHGAYDCLAWIAPLSDFVRAVAISKRPLVGLCFGHQLIAQALGGTVCKSDKGWGIGIRSYTIAAHTDWMGAPIASITLPVCHQDQVLTLPSAATRLASSAHCENFMVHFAPRVLGIQGHPEFAPAFVGELVEWRREKLPETTYDDARESIAKSHDNRMVKQWIMRFLSIPILDL